MKGFDYMNIKKLITASLAVSSVFVPLAQAKSLEFTISSPDMYISDGQIKVETLESAPYIENGRTLVPVRVISEHFGAEVSWSEEDNKVVITSGETVIEIVIGNNKATVNGEVKELDCPAVINNGRTMVPLRFISEQLGKAVTYLDITKQILISDSQPALKVGDSVYTIDDYKAFCDFYGTDNTAEALGEFIPQATSFLSQTTALTAVAKKESVALGEEFKTYITSSVDAYKQQVGGALLLAPIARSLYNEACAYNYVNMVEPVISEDDIKKEYNENYVMAKHILIATKNLVTGEDYTAAQKGDARSKAETILLRTREGIDFDMLIKEFNEDPGMEQSPEGYVFTYGEMVEPFEKAAFNLNVGEVSGIVESAFGYHIIKREKLPEYTAGYEALVRATLKEKAVNQKIESVETVNLMSDEEIIATLLADTQITE